MKIGIDMMGGDFAPLEVVQAIPLYLSQTNASPALFCIGDEVVLKPLIAQQTSISDAVQIIHASETIAMHEPPTRALKEKKHSSISIGYQLLATGVIDAFISAGNTGAMLIGALYSLKPVKGVLRPTISTIIPKLNGGTGLLLDVGLNTDCKAEHLNQFAQLGSLYAKTILEISNPRVGLLNMGEEEGKGNLLLQSTYPMLQENHQLNFIGNIEGRDIFMDKADVTVCDGFTGNVILKMAESIYNIAFAEQVHNNKYLRRFNYETIGGTPVLGVSKPVIIGHGISNAAAFTNMLLLAEKMISSNICEQMAENFSS